jgi:hypothetical protein
MLDDMRLVDEDRRQPGVQTGVFRLRRDGGLDQGLARRAKSELGRHEKDRDFPSPKGREQRFSIRVLHIARQGAAPFKPRNPGKRARMIQRQSHRRRHDDGAAPGRAFPADQRIQLKQKALARSGWHADHEVRPVRHCEQRPHRRLLRGRPIGLVRGMTEQDRVRRRLRPDGPKRRVESLRLIEAVWSARVSIIDEARDVAFAGQRQSEPAQRASLVLGQDHALIRRNSSIPLQAGKRPQERQPVTDCAGFAQRATTTPNGVAAPPFVFRQLVRFAKSLHRSSPRDRFVTNLFLGRTLARRRPALLK